MAAAAAPSPSGMRAQLREAILTLSQRGLKRSANWCAELLQNYSDEEQLHFTTTTTSTPPLSDALIVAKCYFDQQEYDRCAHCLSTSATRTIASNALEFFLWSYATYLSGERRKEEAIREAGDGTALPVNDALPLLIESLTAFRHRDAFCDWLLGVCLKAHGGREEEAKAALLASLQAFPLHWSAWLDLYSLLQSPKEIYSVLPDSPARRFFYVHCLIESQSNGGAGAGTGGEEEVNANTNAFPNSPFQVSQRALFHYGQTDYETAHAWFDRVMELDPYRLASVDSFSNLLFVKEARAELSHLAHQVFKIDRYRSESCVVVGNYYALKRQHERAVVYFQRALKQNRDFHSALILLGHEFVELKNFPAALDTYRKAVEKTPSDYRAWYGLGQAYELNRMFYYALHYYQRAKSLRPYDARIWVALGGNYENLGLIKQAIKCFERAEENDDKEGIALIRLAKLFEKTQDMERAARYFEKHLVRRQREEGLVLVGIGHTAAVAQKYQQDDDDDEDAMASQPKPEDQDALKFLAVYSRDAGRLDLAFTFAENLQRIAGGSQDREIDALLRELQAKKNIRDGRGRAGEASSSTGFRRASGLARPQF